MNNLTAEQAIRKIANSLINTHRPQLGACHSLAVEASLEALAELADELALLDIYAELTKRLEILQGGQRPPVLVGSTPSGDLDFLKLFNEFAIANPQAADEWLFVEGRSSFTWCVDEERMVFQPQDDAAQVSVDDLPFMDNPFFIGADMASGPDATVIRQPITKEVHLYQNRLSVIRISFFVLCQGCLRTSICSKEKQYGMEFCQCGGQWCGCANCHETISQLLSGERDQNKLGLQVPISSWSPVNGCVVVGGAA